MRVNPIPAAFSFMLPGLGQVYQRRFLPGVLCFAGFTALSFLTPARSLLPVLAIGSALESFLSEKKKPATSPDVKPRLSLYAAVGMIGFLGWFSWVSPVFLPVGNLLDTQAQAEELARGIRGCRKSLGRLPAQLSDCPGLSIRDNWGQNFYYGTDDRGFQIRSSGRDKQLGSEDDFVFHYRD